MTDSTGTKESSDNPPSNDDSGRLGISRRHLLGGAAGIVVGSVVGTGYVLLGGEDNGQQISPTEPDEDGEASLGELHYILENSGPENARLDVTQFRYHKDDDVIAITYESRAPSSEDLSEQHLREVEQMMYMFSEYSRQDGNNGAEQGTVIQATIANAADRQADGYAVRREWVQKYNAGDWSGSRTLTTILQTEYGETEPASNASENTSGN